MYRTNRKTLLGALAILITGAVIGWAAMRANHPLEKEPVPGGQISFDVAEPGAGDLSPSQPYRDAPAPRRSAPRLPTFAGITVPAGTPVVVTVNQTMSSKTNSEGDSWTGTVAEPVYARGRVVIPAGSTARGTVALARPAQRGERAALRLALTSVTVDGRRYSVRGSSEAVVAGSPRTRNVGAIAGGTAAGALIGRAVGGSSKGTLVGAIVGGSAAGAAVAASKGYQVTIPAGREIQFTTVNSVRVRA